MHICMVSTAVIPILPNRIGAIEPYVYGLAKDLALTNEVDVFGVGDGQEIFGNLRINAFALTKFQQSLARVLNWRIAYYGSFNLILLKNILQLHKKNPIDIIHIHDVYTGLAATASRLLLGIPYVCSIHNEIRNAIPLRSCNKVLAVSKYIQNFLICEKKINKNKVEVLNDAINIDHLLPHSKTIIHEDAKKLLGLQNRRVILFVGRKCPEKGPQVLLKALISIIKSYPDVLAIFIGPDFYFNSDSFNFTKYLISQAKKLGLENNILFKGFVSNYERQQYYEAADVFVCPSVWNEPFGIVILEALSYCKPVIATQVGGIPELIINNETGLLVPPANPEQLSKAVILLFDDPDFGKKLGTNGRKLVEKNFSFKAVGDRCLQIYETILNQ